MRAARVKLNMECVYTDGELAEKRDQLSETILDIQQVEDDKATVTRTFKERLDGLYGQSTKLAQQIKNRKEFRMVECAVEFNKPNSGEKTTIRLDTGEMTKIEIMTDDERQEKIEFDVEANRDIGRMVKDALDNPPIEPTQPNS